MAKILTTGNRLAAPFRKHVPRRKIGGANYPLWDGYDGYVLDKLTGAPLNVERAYYQRGGYVMVEFSYKERFYPSQDERDGEDE